MARRKAHFATHCRAFSARHTPLLFERAEEGLRLTRGRKEYGRRSFGFFL
jgi:hypothetical protein